MRGHELKKTLADVVARRSSEAGQRAAVQAVLVSNGHTAQPDVRQERVDGVVTRLYVWDSTPWGAVVLQAGPSIVPTVLVEGVDAELARAPAPESRSIGRANPAHPAVVERDNPAKGPDKSLIGSPAAYGAGAEDAWLADIVNQITGSASKPIERNALAAMFRFYLKSLGMPDKTFAVKKESTYLADHSIRVGEYGMEKPTNAQRKLFAEITGWAWPTHYEGGDQVMNEGVSHDVKWYTAGGTQYSSDPYADYPYQGAGGWRVPAKYAPYVGALVAATAKANGVPVSSLGEKVLAAGKKASAPIASSASAYKKPTKGAVTVVVVPGGAGIVYVQGDTYAVKDDIIKPKGLKWAKYATVSSVPEQSWYSVTGSPEGALTIAQGLVESLTNAGLAVTAQGFAPAGSTGTVDAGSSNDDDAQVAPLNVGQTVNFADLTQYPGSFFARTETATLVYVSVVGGMEATGVVKGALNGYPYALTPSDLGDKAKFVYLGSSFSDYEDALPIAQELIPGVYAAKSATSSGGVPAIGASLTPLQAGALPEKSGFARKTPSGVVEAWYRFADGSWGTAYEGGAESYSVPSPSLIPASAWGSAKFIGEGVVYLPVAAIYAKAKAAFSQTGPAPGTVFTVPLDAKADRIAWLSSLPETTWVAAMTLGGAARAIWVDSPGAFLISGGGAIPYSAAQIATSFPTPYIVLSTSSFAGFDEAEADAKAALTKPTDPMWSSTELTPEQADALPIGSIVRIVGTPWPNAQYDAWAGLMVRTKINGGGWRRAKSADAWASDLNAETIQDAFNAFYKDGATVQFVMKTIDPPPYPPEHYQFLQGGQVPAAVAAPDEWKPPVGSVVASLDALTALPIGTVVMAPKSGLAWYKRQPDGDGDEWGRAYISGAWGSPVRTSSALFDAMGTNFKILGYEAIGADGFPKGDAAKYYNAEPAKQPGSGTTSAPAPAPMTPAQIVTAPTAPAPTAPAPVDLATYESLPEGAIVVYVFTSAYSVLKSAAGVYKKADNWWIKAGQKWSTKKISLANVAKKGKVYLVSMSPMKVPDAVAAANALVAKINATATPAPAASSAPPPSSSSSAPMFPEGTVTTDSAVVSALPLGTVIKIEGAKTSTYGWEGFYYRKEKDYAGDVWVKAVDKNAWAMGTLLPPHVYLASKLGLGSTVTIVKYGVLPAANPPEYYAGYLAGIKDAAGPSVPSAGGEVGEKVMTVAEFKQQPVGTVLADHDGDLLVVVAGGGYWWLTEDSFFPEEVNKFNDAASLLPMTVIGQQPSGVPVIDYVKSVSTPGPNTTFGFNVLRWTGEFPAPSKMKSAAPAPAPSAATVSAVTSAGPATAKAVGPWGENPVPVSPVVGARKPADRWNSGVAAFCAKLGPVDLSKKGGSNPGGVAEQPKKTYVKWPKTSAHVASEVLAAQLYRQAGARAPDVRGCAVPKDGDPTAAVLSPWYDKYRKIGASDLEKPLILDEIAEAYLISAWLGNYDVVGLEFDNLLTNGTDVLMVDAGGSLFFRAQGGVKTDFNGGTAGALLTSLLDPQYPAGKLFKDAGVTGRAGKLREVADRIGEMNLDHLKAMATWAGFTGATVANLAQILVERGKAIVAKYGTPPYVAPAPKPKVKGPPAGALITDGEHILLTKRAAWLKDGGVWSIPAGSADVGETPVQTALREAKEELGGLPPGLKPVLSAEVDYTGGKKFVTVVFVLPPGMKAQDWRPWTKGVEPKYATETDGWAWVGLDELDVETDIHGAQRVVWRPRLHVGLGEPVAIGEGDYDGETKAILALAKEHLAEWAAGYASGGQEVVEQPWTLGTEGIPIKKSNPSGYALSGVQETKQGQRYVEYRPRMADGSRPRIRIPVDSVVVGAEQVAQEVKHSIKGVKGGMKLTAKKVTPKTALIAKDGVWLPGDLDDAFEPMLSRVLGIAEPTQQDVHMAAVLAAAGLPINEATPEIAAVAKSPEIASFGSVGSAKLTKKQGEIVQSLYKSLIELLGDDPTPTSTSGAKDPALAKKIKRRMQGAIVKMRAQSTGDYGAASSTSYEYPKGMPRGPWVGGYLRLLVEAKLAGLWRERLDPGKRVVYRTLKHVESSPSFVWDDRSKAAYDAMRAANVTATPVTLPAQGSTAQVRLFTTWIGAQINGPISFIRDGGEFAAVPHSKVVPPSISGLDGGLSFNKVPYGQVTPPPVWADEPWAQVPGFPVGFANYLYIEKNEPAEASHWQVGDSDDEPGWTGNITLRTTADSDPGFVMLPSFLLEGTSYDGELEVEHVHMSETPMLVEVVRAAGNRLTKPQLKAFNRCHPAYPPGFEGPYEKRQRLLMKSNPAPMRANPTAGLVVQSLLFDRNAFSPTQARAWAQGHGYRASNEAFDITDRFIRVRQRDPDDFAEESFVTKTLRPGVKAVMAQEL